MIGVSATPKKEDIDRKVTFTKFEGKRKVDDSQSGG